MQDSLYRKPTSQFDADDVVSRIQRIFYSCPPEEQTVLLEILEELSVDGNSQTYTDVWLADYKEVPVDIETFMCSELYLGKTNRQGKAVYPFWMNTLKEIFNAGNKYEELIFTGATRIGKSSTAIAGVAYMLYRLMCLKDPQTFFNKKEVSKFAILFFNITKDLAKGVAFREFNDTLRASPWFNEHGTFSKSDRDFYYIPEGGKVVIEYGSSGAHALGMQVFCAIMDECVIGSTKIVTSRGVVPIADLVGQTVDVLQYDFDNDNYIYSKGYIRRTKQVNKTIRVTLENGSVLEGTENHLVMLADGSYKKLGELAETDEVMTGGGK